MCIEVRNIGRTLLIPLTPTLGSWESRLPPQSLNTQPISVICSTKLQRTVCSSVSARFPLATLFPLYRAARRLLVSFSIKFSGNAILANKIKERFKDQGPSRTLTLKEPCFRFYIAFSIGKGLSECCTLFFKPWEGLWTCSQLYLASPSWCPDGGCFPRETRQVMANLREQRTLAIW